jgi:membrane-associated protease RseP (regulator of RpoE activity)
MSFLLGVAIFVVALLASIMLHEAGHFATARMFGMKATQFFVGFGRTVWSRQKGETEYGVKAIPAGGFVKIVGMTELEDVDPADEPRSFRKQPGWQRIIVLAAGSFMHFALAFVLLFVIAVGIGLATGSAGTTVGAVESCVPANVNLGCVKGDPKSPATKAGVRVGDKIVSIAGIRVTSWTQMGKAIRAQHDGSAVPVVVDRHGQLVTLHATLASLTGHGAYLGVSPQAVFQRVGPVGAASYAGHEFWTMLSGSASVVATLLQVAAQGREEPRRHPRRAGHQRGRRRRRDRPGASGPDRLAAQGRPGAAHHRLTQHLRGSLQPAPAPAAGRRPPRRGDLRAGPGLARQADGPLGRSTTGHEFPGVRCSLGRCRFAS